MERQFIDEYALPKPPPPEGYEVPEAPDREPKESYQPDDPELR